LRNPLPIFALAAVGFAGGKFPAIRFRC
jgi:hypothetical protein